MSFYLAKLAKLCKCLIMHIHKLVHSYFTDFNDLGSKIQRKFPVPWQNGS